MRRIYADWRAALPADGLVGHHATALSVIPIEQEKPAKRDN